MNLQFFKFFARREPSFVIGSDLVFIPDVSASHQRFGRRYLDFLCTDGEITDCTWRGAEISYSSLAARIAAKEAVMKMLRPSKDTLLPWRTIEVVRDQVGAVHLSLHGQAQQLAKRSRIEALSLSISHEHDYASAFVLATIS
jgi:holo-[acyl-carrier protein] synthase